MQLFHVIESVKHNSAIAYALLHHLLFSRYCDIFKVIVNNAGDMHISALIRHTSCHWCLTVTHMMLIIMIYHLLLILNLFVVNC